MPDWRFILAEHGPAVWQTIYRLLENDSDALDCYQETFLAAWRFTRRGQVDQWGPFLARIAVRRATDRLRQRLRSRARLRELGRVPEPISETEAPHFAAAASELLDRVRDEMGRLPAKQASVFWLSCVEGWSHQEIGEHLRVRPGAVRVLLHRARAALTRRLLSASSRGESQ